MGVQIAREVAELADVRTAGAPPIDIVYKIPQSREWGHVEVDIPFEPANALLGRQLRRHVVTEPERYWRCR